MRRRKRRYQGYGYQEDRYYPRQRNGCFYRVKRFFFGLFITVVILAAIVIAGILIYFGYVFRLYLPRIFLILGIIGGSIILIYFLKWFIEMVSSMTVSISEARQRSIAAKKANVELSRQKIARDEYKRKTAMPRQPLAQPLKTRPLEPASLAQSQRLVRTLGEPTYTRPQQPAQPQPPPVKAGVPGMPELVKVSYRNVQTRLQPGELVALIREDKTLRIEDWNMFKILLVLGGSSSGKTSTIVEKMLAFVMGGGCIVPCDPHSSKEDSLFNKIYPFLSPALFPGAMFAVEHSDILKNMRLVNAELEKRVHGADCSIPVLLVVEELNRLLRDKLIAKEITKMLEALGEEARGFNIYVIVGCQRVTGLADIRKAFISYIVHRCDESEAQLIIPQRYAKYAPELKTGQCFVKDADGVTEAGLQVYVSQQDIQQATRNLQPRYPQQPLVLPATTPPAHVQARAVNPPPKRPPAQQQFVQPPPGATRVYTSQLLKKSRLSPIEPSTEKLYPDRSQAVPVHSLHTWGEANTQTVPDTELVPEPPPVAPPQSVPTNAEQKLARLAQLRQKRTGKIAKKDNEE